VFCFETLLQDMPGNTATPIKVRTNVSVSPLGQEPNPRPPEYETLHTGP